MWDIERTETWDEVRLMKRIPVMVIIGLLGATAATAYLLIPSNVDPVNKFSWSENTGWMNWRDADGTNEGILVNADFLEGLVWMENAGWLDLGRGGGPYANTTGADFGVNVLGNNDLDGMAWGENIGWVNFGWAANTVDANRARIDRIDNRLRGFAWSENTGWINLDDDTSFVGVEPNAVPPTPILDSEFPSKVRFISFSVPASTTAGVGETALRVQLVSLHHPNPPYTGGPSIPFTALEGEARWVGAPQQFVESASSGIVFYASPLQCDPYYQDWSTIALLHVTGSAIVPSSVYGVENVAASCVGVEASCTAVSSPLEISTSRWGDVTDPYNPPSTTSQPDFGDISALVNKFKSADGAPIKARALLGGTDEQGLFNVSFDLSFTHISACVDAFKGFPYPYTIQACP